MNKKFILLAFALTALKYVSACYKAACTPTPSHYEELGCTPILDEDKCCPIRFECPERLGNGPNIGCQYRGRLYKVGESIAEQFLPKRCDASCTCENYEDKNTYMWNCVGISKSELNEYEAQYKLARELDRNIDEQAHDPIERCAGFAVTEGAELATLKKTKCVFEGIIYQKGSKITPEGTCFECICDERLKTQDLDIYTPQCQRKQCAIGISGEDHDFLNRGCVPVYEKTATICCPIEWRCPTDTDIIKKNEVPLPTELKSQCKFGGRMLDRLDHVMYVEGDKLNCKCYIPPMVHCLKNALV